MSSALAWLMSLALAAASPAPVDAGRPPADAPEARVVPVQLELGPPIIRRMGVRVTVRRAGDDPIMHRPVDVHEFPPPATTDDAPAPARLSLPAGSYIFEAETPGFLPSTRAVSVDPDAPPAPVDWQLLPDTSHRTVRFTVTAAAATTPPTVTLTARHVAGEQAPVGCTARRVPCELRLRRGEWELEARAPGFQPLRRAVSVGDDDAQNVELALVPGIIDHSLPDPPPGRPDDQPVAPPHQHRKHVLALSLAAVPLFAGGLALAVVGRVRYGQSRSSSSCDSYGRPCADAIIPQIHVGGVGTGLLGAGLGLAAAGLTGLRDVKPSVWWAELGVGGALTLAGGAWLVGNSVLLDRDLKTGPLADIDARNGRRMASSLILGAGLGLVAGSLTVILLHKSPPRRSVRLSPFGGRDLAGLSLSGSF